MSSKGFKQMVMPFISDSGASGDDPRAWGVSSNSLYQKCIEKWGAEAQIYQGAEECMELALALHHILRAEKTAKALGRVIEEVADVELMLEQVKYLLSIPNESIRAVKKKKTRRLRRLLKNGNRQES